MASFPTLRVSGTCLARTTILKLISILFMVNNFHLSKTTDDSLQTTEQ
jgi:hypothetical protein